MTVEPILSFLAAEAVLSNYVLDLQVGGYGSYADELLNSQSALADFKPDLILILLDLEEIAGRLPDLCADGIGAKAEEEIEECAGRMAQLLRSFRSGNSARILLQGLVVPDLTSLGDVGDANLSHSLPSAVLQLNRKLAAICRTVYSRGLVRAFSAMFRAPRKVLCTDLDNTLWGGVLGEDGPEGIATGSAFPGNCYLDYQMYLKQLSSRGILLAIVSKNNEADVRDAFHIRSADLALSLENFAQEMSLGLDSFVFVDDNPVECEAIRQQLPEVAVVEAPIEEPWKLVEILSAQPFFDTSVVTDDDVNRLNEYKAQAQRAELASRAGSRDEFLASLGIVCTFQSALQAPLSRAVQLLAKTNQFNLTTRRHSAAEIEDFASVAGGQAVVVRVRDRFGDAGVVGLALARNQGDSCIIDSLLLSCRVIGRGIETALLGFLGERALRTGAKRLVGEFIATKKNAPCANFYPDHGFIKRIPMDAVNSESLFYELDLTVSVPMSPKWITLEGDESNEFSASAVVTS